jgi:hypothetical protein
MIQHQNTVLVVDQDATRMRKMFLKGPAVMGDRQGPLPDHIRIGLHLLPTPLRELVVAV